MSNKPTVLILGATSSIAKGIAAAFAVKGYSLFLGARDISELDRIAADLRIRYETDVHFAHFDSDKWEEHPVFLQQVIEKAHRLDGVVYAAGELGDQKKAEHDFAKALEIIHRNYTGSCSILSLCANILEKHKRGFIIGIGSVAGDRGRQSNYLYGSAKGAFALFLQGLRNRLFPSGVRVITIKPGFVDTAMTFGKPGLFLVADPHEIGKKIVQSLEKNRDIVYLPWFWKYIMGIIKCIPETIFKRLKL